MLHTFTSEIIFLLFIGQGVASGESQLLRDYFIEISELVFKWKFLNVDIRFGYLIPNKFNVILPNLNVVLTVFTASITLVSGCNCCHERWFWFHQVCGSWCSYVLPLQWNSGWEPASYCRWSRVYCGSCE